MEELAKNLKKRCLHLSERIITFFWLWNNWSDYTIKICTTKDILKEGQYFYQTLQKSKIYHK